MTTTGWLDDLPVSTALVLVSLVLVAESGLVAGLVLPGASLVLGLGVLVGADLLPAPVAVLTVATATVLGGALGHRAALRDGADHLLRPGGVLAHVLPRRALDVVDRSASPWAEAIGRRPVRSAAVAQCLAGARTLAPRLAAVRGVPLPTVLRGTVPAALVWSAGLVTAGAAAGAALTLVRGALTVAGIPLVVAVTWLLLRRRGHGTAPRRRYGAAGHHLLLDSALLIAVLLVALLTLTPAGASASDWGAPLTELHWYATGLDSAATLVQLLGNLVLLMPLAVLAVLRWPGLGHPAHLTALPATAAISIELLQWVLPLGRVVSPVDAVLNAAGALVAGLVAARLRRRWDGDAPPGSAGATGQEVSVRRTLVTCGPTGPYEEETR